MASRASDARVDDTSDGAAAHDSLDGMRLTLEITIPSEVRYIERVVDLVTAQCAGFQYPRGVCSLNVRVALSEAVSNAVLRGNHEDPSKHVVVRVQLDAEHIVLDIQDEGDGFDVDAFDPDPTTPDQLEREDGRGLFLMRKLMDSVERVPVDAPGTRVRLTLQRA